MLTTDIHLVPTLRMSGPIPPLPIYNSMACTGTTLPLPFALRCHPLLIAKFPFHHLTGNILWTYIQCHLRQTCGHEWKQPITQIYYEVVTEFSAMTINYMHSSPSGVTAWLNGFSLPSRPLCTVFDVNKNQVPQELSFITGPNTAEWWHHCLLSSNNVIPYSVCHPVGKKTVYFWNTIAGFQ
jgi:hypothetical protein